MIPGAIESNVDPTSSSLRRGSLVTGDATAHVKGPWSELIASTGGDAEGIWVAVMSLSTSSTDTGILLDIGIGAESSEVVLVPDLAMGYADAQSPPLSAQTLFVPIAIASGTRVSARLQGVQSSEAARVAIWLARSVQHVEGASSFETVGEDTANSRGTTVTPAANAFGSWTSIGTISADRNTLLLRVDGFDGTVISSEYLIELGYGSSAPGAGGTAIVGRFRVHCSSQEVVAGPYPNTPVYVDLASGETLWARVASAATDPIGISIVTTEAPLASLGGISVSLGVNTGGGSVQTLTKEPRALLPEVTSTGQVQTLTPQLTSGLNIMLPVIAGGGDPGGGLGVLHELAALQGVGSAEDLLIGPKAVLPLNTGVGSPQDPTVAPTAALPVLIGRGRPQDFVGFLDLPGQSWHRLINRRRKQKRLF